MKNNLQGYALPLAIILVAIFSIFVANISLNSDSSIQNYIKDKYQNLNSNYLTNLSLNNSNLPTFSFTLNQQIYFYAYASSTNTFNIDRSEIKKLIKNLETDNN